MKVIDEGHKYILDTFDDSSNLIIQPLVFMKRKGDHYPGNTSAYAGTNSQSVLRCLINRNIFVNNQITHYTNDIALRLLRSTILMYELRAAEIHNLLDQLGTQLLIQTNIEDLPVCKHCGHLVCKQFKVD